MALIRSISGIRGTIGGWAGDALTPIDVVNYTTAFSAILKLFDNGSNLVVLGRDARISGEMVQSLVTGALLATGMDVIDLGMATTPGVALAVKEFDASGGIVITASHNPMQWNGLKLMFYEGEFLSEIEGKAVFSIAESAKFKFAEIQNLGKLRKEHDFLHTHIRKILELPLVQADIIRKANLRIVVDAVNSVGGIAVPMLLRALGVNDIIELYCEPNGQFPHDPEPLPENLTEISETVLNKQAHLGIVVDPDVDRLAFVDENGNMFGEEYTIVAVADYVLSHEKGNTVSNLSSSKALQVVTERHGGKYFASAVGEVNVVEAMKEHNAVIGGEGNGGVIYPALHRVRDALVGIALFLTHLVRSGKSCSALRATYPELYISKNKIQLAGNLNIDGIFERIGEKYAKQPIVRVDGIRIEFGNDWVHLRKSNTEPVMRIYAESDSMPEADALARKLIDDTREIIKILHECDDEVNRSSKVPPKKTKKSKA